MKKMFTLSLVLFFILGLNVLEAKTKCETKTVCEKKCTDISNCKEECKIKTECDKGKSKRSKKAVKKEKPVVVEPVIEVVKEAPKETPSNFSSSVSVGHRFDNNVLNQTNIEKEKITTKGARVSYLGFDTSYKLYDAPNIYITPKLSIGGEKYHSAETSVFSQNNAYATFMLSAGVKKEMVDKKELNLSFDYSYGYEYADINSDESLEFNLFTNSFKPTLSYQLFGTNTTSVSMPMKFYLNKFDNGQNDAREFGLFLKQSVKVFSLSSSTKIGYLQYNSKTDLADNDNYIAALELSHPITDSLDITMYQEFSWREYINDRTAEKEQRRSSTVSLVKKIKVVSLEGYYNYQEKLGNANYVKSVVGLNFNCSF